MQGEESGRRGEKDEAGEWECIILHSEATHIGGIVIYGDLVSSHIFSGSGTDDLHVIAGFS